MSDKALHDTLLAQFHCKVVAKVSVLKKDIKKLEIMHFNPPSPTLFKFVLLKGQISKIFSETHIIMIAMNEVPFESLSSGESFDRVKPAIKSF